MAATGNDQVKALVYLNGWMCDEGESQQEQPVGVILNGFRTASQSPRGTNISAPANSQAPHRRPASGRS
jgi:hypothetical protein